MALNVTVMVSSCKMSEFETFALVPCAAYRTLERQKRCKSGQWKLLRAEVQSELYSVICLLNHLAREGLSAGESVPFS